MQEYSDWLNSAERIIFYGYSLGDTDRQYFEKFFRKLCSGDSSYTELVFYYYGQASYDNSWQKVEEALKRLDEKLGGTFVCRATCVIG